MCGPLPLRVGLLVWREVRFQYSTYLSIVAYIPASFDGPCDEFVGAWQWGGCSLHRKSALAIRVLPLHPSGAEIAQARMSCHALVVQKGRPAQFSLVCACACSARALTSFVFFSADTHLLKQIDAGALPEWAEKQAPAIARNYWKMPPEATLRDVRLSASLLLTPLGDCDPPLGDCD